MPTLTRIITAMLGAWAMTRPTTAVTLRSQSAPQIGSYVIESRDRSIAEYTVTARIVTRDSTLRMSGYGASGQSNGWATFVSGLEADDCAGNALVVEEHGARAWRIAGWRGGLLCLSYRLEFARGLEAPWPDGPRTAGIYSDGHALFANTGALFVYGDSTSSATVDFRLADGMTVTAAWPRVGTNRYRAPVSSLIRNTVVIGRHEAATQAVGPLTVRTVMLGTMRSAIGLVGQAVAAIGTEYLGLYPDSPERDFLFVWFPDGRWETGEAYENSFAIVSATVPGTGNRLIWANSIAHELHHYWNGHLFSAADWEAGNWFVEGFTEYMANLALVRSGIVSEAQFANLVQKHLTLFHNFQFRWGTPYERISLVDAGSQKSTNNVAIYDGGWFAALMFDVLMRRASNGRVGVDDVLTTLFETHRGRTFTNEDVIRIAETLSGADLRSAYDAHVAGRHAMPLSQYLEWAGFDATITPYVIELELDADPDEQALRMRRAMLRGPRAQR